MPNDTALTTSQKVSTLRDMLEKNEASIAMALPSHLTPERMIRVALTAFQTTPALQECSPRSIVGAVVEASQLGLECDGVLGHGYLVPFNNRETKQKEAQFMIGYRGMIALARRSGEIQSLSAEIVKEKDTFKLTKGLEPNIIHEPYLGNDPENPITGAYAVANFKDGGVQFNYMSLEDIESQRRQSKMPDGKAWKNHFEEMAKKTVIRRLFKMLPVSIEDVTRAIVQDEYRDTGYIVGNDFVAPIKDVTDSAAECDREDESMNTEEQTTVA